MRSRRRAASSAASCTPPTSRAQAYVDDGEDKLTLHLLVFKTLPPAPRASLLRHFAAGAAAASGPPARPNIVAVDIDDTLHPYLFDQSSAAGEPYPGVLDCLAALVAGPQGGTPGRLAVITARPGLARSYTRAAMRKLGLGHATVYTGTLTALVSTDSMAARKLQNFDRLRQLWPEGRLVWVGDMGQGDCLAGQQLLAQPCHADCPPPLVLMHDIVLRGAKQVPSTCLAKRRQLARTGVFVFDSYIDAAVVAVQAGAADPRCLLPLALAALRRVGLRPPRLAAHADTLAAWAEQQVPVQGEQLPSFRLPGAAVAGEVLGMPRAPTKAPAPTAPPAAAATDAAAVSPSHAGALQGPPPPRMPPPPLTLPVGLGLYAVTGSAGHATCRGMAVPRTCPLGLPGLAVQWQSGDDVAADGGLRMPGCAPRTDTADPAQYPGLSTSQPSPGGLPATPHHVQVLGGAAATTAIHNASCGCSPATALSDDSPWPSWAHAQAAPAVQAAAAASRYQNLRDNMRRLEAQAAAERALALLALAAAVPDPPCRAGEGGGGPYTARFT